MIPKEIKQKPFEYLLLVAILTVASIAFFTFSHTPQAQRRVIYLTGGAYMFWSLLHHYRRGDLTLPIVLEYLIIALFASVLIATTLV
jgi:hypothetical protein